jgi:type I restriction enzyme S subunit
MRSEWKELPFTEAVEVNPKVFLEKGQEYPFVDMKAVDPSWQNASESEYRVFKSGGARFMPYDTLMARITPCLENGKIARFVPKINNDGPAFGSTEFIIIRGREGVTENDFAYYLTKWQEFRNFAVSQMTGSSGRQRVPADSLAGFSVPIPELEEQRAIAHILGLLDDKIELNRQMNRTLEAMAQAIFKSWFVDFDPVRAKAEGRDPGLPNEIAAFFPDSFQDSDLGEIPKGWKVKEIRECCSKIQNGGTPKRSESDYWNPGTIPWLTSGEVRQTLITTTENMISELGLKKSSAKWLPKDSTVVALYGATAGQVALISSKMTTNQAVCGLIPKASFQYFNYLSLDRSVGILANLARGSAQQNISKGIVETTKVIIPRADILESFDHVVSSMFDKWIANLEESKSLASLRDTLLPKLISGELRLPAAALELAAQADVPDAENFVEEARG